MCSLPAVCCPARWHQDSQVHRTLENTFLVQSPKEAQHFCAVSLPLPLHWAQYGPAELALLHPSLGHSLGSSCRVGALTPWLHHQELHAGEVQDGCVGLQVTELRGHPFLAGLPSGNALLAQLSHRVSKSYHGCGAGTPQGRGPGSIRRQ